MIDRQSVGTELERTGAGEVADGLVAGLRNVQIRAAGNGDRAVGFETAGANKTSGDRIELLGQHQTAAVDRGSAAVGIGVGEDQDARMGCVAHGQTAIGKHAGEGGGIDIGGDGVPRIGEVRHDHDAAVAAIEVDVVYENHGGVRVWRAEEQAAAAGHEAAVRPCLGGCGLAENVVQAYGENAAGGGETTRSGPLDFAWIGANQAGKRSV